MRRLVALIGLTLLVSALGLACGPKDPPADAGAPADPPADAGSPDDASGE